MIYSRNLSLGGHNGQVFAPRIYDQSMVRGAPEVGRGWILARRRAQADRRREHSHQHPAVLAPHSYSSSVIEDHIGQPRSAPERRAASASD